jgi:hypothetical protein
MSEKFNINNISRPRKRGRAQDKRGALHLKVLNNTKEIFFFSPKFIQNNKKLKTPSLILLEYLSVSFKRKTKVK